MKFAVCMNFAAKSGGSSLKYTVSNILDEIDDGGAEQLQADLSTFSSPQNAEIEDFIRNKAIG